MKIFNKSELTYMAVGSLILTIVCSVAYFDIQNENLDLLTEVVGIVNSINYRMSQ